ncbi:MAG: signal recognition particle protein, partial [Kiritimatiellota bacterium]|nr:signal recognition particle protein [Kiritimatiellota bacterium]
VVGQQASLRVHDPADELDPIARARGAVAEATMKGFDVVIVDTAGRLHIDVELMDELAQIKKATNPTEVLLVVDAMTGQDAVRVAEEFNQKVNITGLILTKMDGDARGGAALSMRWVTGVPIRFIGTGEKPDAFEPFYPDRLASRILGMGDMLTFIEKAQATFDEQKARELEKKVKSARFDLTDFLEQLRALRKMGPLSQVMDMLPGFGKLAANMPAGADEKQLKKVEAIILSMTPAERQNPMIIGGSRRKRIARGSGVQIQDVNQLLNQFAQIQKLMKMGMQGKLPKNLMGMFR